MRRRGCLVGVGGVLVALILCCALGYFVALPRLHQQVEDEVGRVLSTEVARRIDEQAPNVGNVAAGEYRISLSDVEREISSGSENLRVEGMNLRADGDDLVVRFAISDASSEFRFTPQVTPEGYLRMADAGGDGGFLEQLLGPESLGNAIEASVNDYLQANGLYLQDVTLADNDLVLVLGER